MLTIGESCNVNIAMIQKRKKKVGGHIIVTYSEQGTSGDFLEGTSISVLSFGVYSKQALLS